MRGGGGGGFWFGVRGVFRGSVQGMGIVGGRGGYVRLLGAGGLVRGTKGGGASEGRGGGGGEGRVRKLLERR